MLANLRAIPFLKKNNWIDIKFSPQGWEVCIW